MFAEVFDNVFGFVRGLFVNSYENKPDVNFCFSVFWCFAGARLSQNSLKPNLAAPGGLPKPDVNKPDVNFFLRTVREKFR